jgi:hypothetical protein
VIEVMGSGAVGAGGGVEARLGDAEALDGAAAEDVFADDLLGVLGLDVAVPDGLGVDDDDGAVLALVEAAGLVGADAALEAGLLQELLQDGEQGAGAVGGAAGAGRAGGAAVLADKDVTLECGHEGLLREKKE